MRSFLSLRCDFGTLTQQRRTEQCKDKTAQVDVQVLNRMHVCAGDEACPLCVPYGDRTGAERICTQTVPRSSRFESDTIRVTHRCDMVVVQVRYGAVPKSTFLVYINLSAVFSLRCFVATPCNSNVQIQPESGICFRAPNPCK